MRVTPKTEQQIQSEGLCPEGWWEAVVETAEEMLSKSGNEMIKLGLTVYTGNGERRVFDYLLDAIPHKVRHFCEAAGLMQKYESSSLLDRDCVGKCVMIEITHRTQTKGEYAGRVQASVNDYKAVERGGLAKPAPASAGKRPAPSAAPAQAVEIQADDIPFDFAPIGKR